MDQPKKMIVELNDKFIQVIKPTDQFKGDYDGLAFDLTQSHNKHREVKQNEVKYKLV